MQDNTKAGLKALGLIILGAWLASVAWYVPYSLAVYQSGLFREAMKTCKGPWKLYGENSVIGSRFECEKEG